MNYIFSPEFHRNLWIKCTPLKLVAAPGLLFLCAMIAMNTPTAAEALYKLGETLFIAAVFLWGNYEAAHALQDEIRERTWDQQRMAPQGPLGLALGKLFGVTSYTWYAGFLALFMMAWAGNTGAGALPLPYVLMTLALAGVFGQAMALLFAFTDLAAARQRNLADRVPGGKRAFLLGAVASFWVWGQLKTIVAPGAELVAQLVRDAGLGVTWFGMELQLGTFALFSTLFFCGWCLVGLVRMARAELMYRMTPVFWLAFAASAAAWCAGLAKGTGVFTLYGVFFVLTYGAMTGEAWDTRRTARFLAELKKKRVPGLFIHMPKWVATLPFTLLLLGAFLATAEKPGAVTVAAGLCLFGARDALATYAFAAGGGGAVRVKQVLFYILLYFLLPALQGASSISAIEMRDILNFQAGAPGEAVNKTGLNWFFPLPNESIIDGLLPPALQVLGAGIFLAWSLRKKRAEDEEKTT